METIEVRYGHTALGRRVPFKHKYLVYTDNAGVEHVARGGPGYSGPGAAEGRGVSSSSPFGNITTSHGLFDESHPDWDNEGDDARETIVSGGDLSAVWESIRSAMDDIELERHPYWPRQNSNTAIDEALRRSGLPEPVLDDFGENWSPGSGRPLTAAGGNPGSLFELEGWMGSFEQAENTSPPPSCPIVLDLNDDGTRSIDTNAGTHFDHAADGFAEATGWVDANDGLLVWDRDSDGRIESGRELFGNQTMLQNGQLAANGFAALAEWDGNLDGKIDSADSVWGNLQVWQDVDGDGFSVADELLSMTEAGVLSINLAYSAGSGVDANGNEEWLTGSFTRTDASTGEVTDYRFAADTVRSIAEEWLAVPAAIAALPDVSGFGKVYDLQQAMARDTGGVLQGLVEDFTSEQTVAGRNALIDQILLKWTNADGVDPASRGGNIDARRLVALEAFMGRGFIGVGGSSNPNSNAAVLLNEAYKNLTESVYGQLMAQTHLASLYDLVSYSWNEATEELVGHLGAVLDQLKSGLDADDGSGVLAAAEFVRSVKGLGAESALGLDAFQSSPALASLLNNTHQLIVGTEAADGASGGASADLVLGLESNDSISTAEGNDLIHGGSGDDSITSGSGDDVVYGGTGNDTVTDVGGNDVVYGGDGNDVITVSSYYWGSNTVYGGAGNDTIAMPLSQWTSTQAAQTQTYFGGTGNDVFTGGNGANVYHFARGDGADTVTDNSSGYAAQDRIVFGAGISVSDLSVHHSGVAPSGYDLELRIADTGNPAADDRITIKNWYLSSDYQIEQVEFADGTVLTSAQVTAMAIVAGTEGNDSIQGYDTSDVIYGYGGDDTITDRGGNDTVYGGDGNDSITVSSYFWGSNTVYGGAGNDTITMPVSQWTSNQAAQTQTYIGGTGNDVFTGGNGTNVYHFARGDGADTVTDNSSGYAAQDRIVFGTGIAVSDLSVRRTGAAPGGYDLELRIADSSNPGADDRIMIKNWYLSANYQIERVEFADGTVLTPVQVSAMAIVAGTEGNDSIQGYDTSDVIYGYGGDDTITDRGGNDTVYGGDGNDSITVSSYFWGSNTVYGGAGNDTITMPVSQWTSNQAAQTQTYVGGTGNDVFAGGNGTNVYHFARGDGADTVTDNSSGYAAQDRIVFGTGIAVSDLSVRRTGAAPGGYDLELRIADPGNPAADDRIAIKNWYLSANYQIERVEFADGTVLTPAQVTAMAIVAGTEGNDSIQGYDTSDVIYGYGGDDTITDRGGNDTVYGGDGNDSITVSSYFWGSNTVYGGAGNDTISIPLTQWPSNQAVQTQTLIGGTGNDVFNVGIGSNVYLYGRGDGADTITDNSYSYGGTDRIVFGSDISIGDVTAQRSGSYDLELRVANPADPAANDRITIKYWYLTPNNQIERFEFSDGTVVLASGIFAGNDSANSLTGSAGVDLIGGGAGNDVISGGAGNDSAHGGDGNDTVSGQDGNDLLYGDAGDDTLSGGAGSDYAAGGVGNDSLDGGVGNDILQGGDGADQVLGGEGNDLVTAGAGADVLNGGDGNDLLAGGAGDDTIHTGTGSNIVSYNAGDGIDTVHSVAGGSNTLSFGGGIDYDDLSLSKDGNDLVVSAGANDRVVLKDWYAGSATVLNLQIILDASAAFDANSSDPLFNKKVQTFDFMGLVSEFDDVLAQSPGLTSWAVTNALLAFHLSGSDDAAIGGDLAYWYGKNNGFGGIGLAAAQQVIDGTGFGGDAQTLRPFSGLQEGLVKLT